MRCVSPWYRTGWLGVKHQLTYLPNTTAPTELCSGSCSLLLSCWLFHRGCYNQTVQLDCSLTLSELLTGGNWHVFIMQCPDSFEFLTRWVWLFLWVFHCWENFGISRLKNVRWQIAILEPFDDVHGGMSARIMYSLGNSVLLLEYYY